jgi:uncharacterized repeat protein (TIGR03803 family)
MPVAQSWFKVGLLVSVVVVLAAMSSASPKEVVLYDFPGDYLDGAGPIWSGSLVADAEGNLYGTTMLGGNAACGGICGTVFELSPAKGEWTRTVLYEFAGGVDDGAQPDSGLVFDKAGNLYGTTVQGGSLQQCGTVYRLSRNGDGSYTESVLHAFDGSANDGCNPLAPVIIDDAGNVFGTTYRGGPGGGGTVFELTNTGGTWNEKVLWAFTDDLVHEYDLNGPVAIDKAGNLYGTTAVGGQGPSGTVFELTQTGGIWTETVIYNFQYYFDGRDGAGPIDGVTFDGAGNIYGTTTAGGTGTNCVGGSCGTVYRLQKLQNGWKESVLYNFQGGKDGDYPTAGLTLIGKKLYGTTAFGGSGSCKLNEFTGCGTIFSLERSGGRVVEKSISLKGTNGALPQARVVPYKGALVGTTLYGGSGSCDNNLPGCGVVFAIVP